MLKLIIAFLAVFSANIFFSQGWNPVGARSMSLANASVCLNDVWSFHHNPGALAGIKQTSVGVSYENRYLLKEMQAQAFVLAHPIKKGVLSLGAQTFGQSLYRTARVGLGYSLQLSDKISAGVQINYLSTRITNYGQKGNISGEFGVLGKINDKVNIGFSVLNLNRAKLADFQDDRFSTFLRVGVSYTVSSKVLVLAEVEKEIESKVRPKGAMEYQFSDKFFLRAGFAANPIEFTFGTGFVFSKQFKLDLGSAWDQQLGWSPHFGFTYDFKSKVK